MQPRGVVVLIGVIVMSVMLLLLAAGINLVGHTSLRGSDTYDDALISSYHADACMDEALIRLRRNSSYSGGTLSLGQVTCRINVTNTGGTGRTVLAEGEFNAIREAVQVIATVSGSVTVTSWSRCPSEGNARMEAGTVTSVTDAWQHVAFRQCYRRPVMKALHLESASTTANVVRIRNVTSSGFDIRLQNPAGSTISGETVNYMVVEEGAFTLVDGTKIEAHRFSTNTTGSSSGWNSDLVTYSNVYSVAPVVLAQAMTSYDDVFVSTWVNGGAQTTPPTTTVLRIGLNMAQVASTHTVDEIGWIAIDSAKNSTVASTTYQTLISANAVSGHDSGCSSVNYASAFSVSPILLAQLLAMDDGDGGWLVQCATSTTAARLHVEEDQVVDGERTHAAEQAGIVAFGAAFVHSQ